MTRRTGASAGIRWWPAVVIVTLAALALAVTWLDPDPIRQWRTLRTLTNARLLCLSLLGWFVVLSRARLRWRVAAGAAALLIVVAAPRVLRIRGVTGDMLPLPAWRWEEDVGARLGAAEVSPAGTAASAPAPPASPGSPVAAPAPVSPAVGSQASSGEATPMPAPAATTEATEQAVPRAPSAAPRSSPSFPQFLGPARDATLRGIRLARDWEAQPPILSWRRPVGAGWSGFAMAGGLAITQEQRGQEEAVVAYDLATGEQRWLHAETACYETTVAGAGPRATPTIDGDRVYTTGATGILNCLEAATGRLLWRHHALEENRSSTPTWGWSVSPLVVDDLVIVATGGPAGRSLAAYHAATGELAWTAGSDRAAYSSPLVTTLAGRRQILIFNEASLAAHNPASGRLLWQHPMPRGQPNVAQPLVLPGDLVLTSVGYGIGSKLLQISAGADGELSTSLIWESPRMKAKFTNLVRRGEHVYGLDDGVLACLDPATGERCWKRGRYGHGQLLLIEDLLLVQAEDGAVVLIEPNPVDLNELARFQALEGKTWNTPALAGDLLLVRNDREAACWRLPLE